MEEKRLGSKIKSYCSRCNGERNCEVFGHHLESGEDGDGYYQWNTNWYLLKCCGCDFSFAQSVGTNSENYSNAYDQHGDVETIYHETIRTLPARSKRDRPEWFSHDVIETDVEDSTVLDSSLKELYAALDNDLLVLASIGVRTSFDIAAELLGIDSNKRFDQKVADLVEKGFIKESEKEHIDFLIDAGSASAHRGWRPRLADLAALMELLEDFIYNSFVVPARKKASAARVAKIKAKVPPKKRAAAKTPPAEKV